MEDCIYCGPGHSVEEGKRCGNCGNSQDKTSFDDPKSINEFIDLISKNFFQMNQWHELEGFLVGTDRLRKKMSISYEAARDLFEKLKNFMEEKEPLGDFELYFNQNVVDAFAGHDTHLGFKFLNKSTTETLSCYIFWDDRETEDEDDLHIKTKRLIKPNETVEIGGTHIFSRAGQKEIDELIITIENQFNETAKFQFTPFTFKVQNPTQSVINQITTKNEISIEGRGVVDAANMGSSPETSKISEEPKWIKLEHFLIDDCQIELELSKDETMEVSVGENNSKSLENNSNSGESELDGKFIWISEWMRLAADPASTVKEVQVDVELLAYCDAIENDIFDNVRFFWDGDIDPDGFPQGVGTMLSFNVDENGSSEILKGDYSGWFNLYYGSVLRGLRHSLDGNLGSNISYVNGWQVYKGTFCLGVRHGIGCYPVIQENSTDFKTISGGIYDFGDKFGLHITKEYTDTWYNNRSDEDYDWLSDAEAAEIVWEDFETIMKISFEYWGETPAEADFDPFGFFLKDLHPGKLFPSNLKKWGGHSIAIFDATGTEVDIDTDSKWFNIDPEGNWITILPNAEDFSVQIWIYDGEYGPSLTIGAGNLRFPGKGKSNSQYMTKIEDFSPNAPLYSSPFYFLSGMGYTDDVKAFRLQEPFSNFNNIETEEIAFKSATSSDGIKYDKSYKIFRNGEVSENFMEEEIIENSNEVENNNEFILFGSYTNQNSYEIFQHLYDKVVHQGRTFFNLGNGWEGYDRHKWQISDAHKKNVNKSLPPLGQDEYYYALVDDTALARSCKEYLAYTNERLIYKGLWADPVSIPYSDILSVTYVKGNLIVKDTYQEIKVFNIDQSQSADHVALIQRLSDLNKPV